MAGLTPAPRATSPSRWRFVLLATVIVGSIFALFADRVLPNVPKIRPLAAVDPGTPAIGESEWRENPVASGAPASRYRLATRSSAVGGDAYTGKHVTHWYRAVPRITVLVIGGPTRPGNELSVEFQCAGGRTERLVFTGNEPGESWQPWIFSAPADAEALRIHAVDANRGFRGWLGFTEPCAVTVWDTISWKMVLQTLATVALALTLVWGPGVALAARRGRGPGWATLWVGPLWLATGGIVCWVLGGWVPARVICTIWVGATLATVIFITWRHRAWRLWSSAEARVLTLALLCVLGAAAKAAFSGGPAGELYAGQICRTLEASGHSDSRISFHTLQLVANHFAPHGPESNGFFLPWTFSSRGPLAGLAAAPGVLATGGVPPRQMPEQSWEPFDRTGFAAYRITMAALSSLGLIAVFNLLRLVADERRAQLGVGLLALAPFFWHELYFSWPKAVTAAWVVGAFSLVWRARAFTAGLALGGAYLWHPLALLSAPFLAGWALAFPREGWRPALRRAVRFSAGVVLVVAAWQVLNLAHPGQAGFLGYFINADEGAPTLTRWLLSRWNNFANTLIPFYVLLFNVHHPSFGAFTGPSDAWLLYFRQCWTTAPFAVGLAAWCAWLPQFLRGMWRHRGVASLTLVGPFLFLVAYWGGAATGLMREAGQPLFLAGWVFLAWSAREPLWNRPVLVALAIAGAAEILGMMFLPSLAPASRHFSVDLWLNDCLWLAVAGACVTATAAISYRLIRARPAGEPATAG
jgi:hypothetical protein